MDVSIGPHWERFIAELVTEGRYPSAADVMREGLRLVEEREDKLRTLRTTIDTAIERGGALTDDDMEGRLRHYTEERKAGRS